MNLYLNMAIEILTNNFILRHFKYHLNYVTVFNQETLRQCTIFDLSLGLIALIAPENI